jgi:hypothetical protein
MLDAGTAKPEADPTPGPQEADVLADLPPADAAPVPKFLDRARTWAAALTGTRTFQVLFPVLMLALTGSAAYGVLRRRRPRRPRPGHGPTPVPDTITWLPGSAGAPPPERP